MENRFAHEEYAIVLDFLKHGYPFHEKPGHISTPIVQAIGTDHFVLLELVPKKDVELQPSTKVYIGDGKRDHIHHINGRLPPERLTQTAKTELEFIVADLVKKNEKRFIEFFNRAQPLSTRMHSIELIPGMGKKRTWEILEERKASPFESFQDMRSRTKLIPDPEKGVVQRILEEITTQQKHYLFVDAFSQ
ncbi:DUF655 domain-containing protein [Candidatus Woesearchaeota archaeon CG08_land_8_20_14_0_20_47_9]|nr:MAG: hypothetical protein AUJ69_00075 [Candidatus Woesearchaeota archaeon CG1_02_47_18]PIN71991.1 MAG: DNA-binding protein [Candidatus Woesearchaeota archaeon CG10_big_fil_rev_8_21_14_0_10_47_5]PIO03725.1 MAG: DUF655 domain-containing protein [Candidatus Woesearchaeota archaeon CG08_land_8_20_14_0_20_47_9]HII29901.1 DUF655 domain-containing protein [Candidatus Woesearchaeota archaeon]